MSRMQLSKATQNGRLAITCMRDLCFIAAAETVAVTNAMPPHETFAWNARARTVSFF